jgi:hypothetical protein
MIDIRHETQSILDPPLVVTPFLEFCLVLVGLLIIMPMLLALF